MQFDTIYTSNILPNDSQNKIEKSKIEWCYSADVYFLFQVLHNPPAAVRI